MWEELKKVYGLGLVIVWAFWIMIFFVGMALLNIITGL